MFHRLAYALMAADLEGARVWVEEELRGGDPLRLRRVLELLPDLGEVDGLTLPGSEGSDGQHRGPSRWVKAR